MENLIKAAQLILSLSILVTVHEFGHYITARIFKTRVEKFYLFFDFLFPFPNIMNFALFKKKIGETEYGIGWFPLGGYVKIAGMIDESMDEEFLKSEPQPYEFRSKPAWQRLIIMLGGITMNIILAWVIYSMLIYKEGEHFTPTENVKSGYYFDSLGTSLGLMNGDKIISYNDGKKFKDAEGIGTVMLFNQAHSINIERGGKLMKLPVTDDFYRKMLEDEDMGFAEPLFPCDIDSFTEPFLLKNAGAKIGDRIIKLDTIDIHNFGQFHEELPNFKNKQVTIEVLRGKDTISLSLKLRDTARVGFSYNLDKYFEPVNKEYGFFAAFPAGAKRSYESFTSAIKQYVLMLNPRLKLYKKVGSFLSIGKQFNPKWDWLRFWIITAFLSNVLAFVNLWPIPGLDGGHALFTVYEIVTRRKPSDKFMEYAQVVGMFIIFAIMFYAIGNDILRVFFGKHW